MSWSVPLPGARLGHYRVLRELGRGGMGTVHLAERDQAGFEQQVALKLASDAHDPKRARETLAAERAILARLEHPNIARLLDAGETEAGQPFLVLEYVPGQPITEFADARRLSVDDRLRLFAAVARAVQAAHENLVIHADLKPGNVLVTDDGTPKLLDFGVARRISEQPDATHSPTEITIEYASPEQAEGGPTTTATDVFGLGTLLYELLTGQRPFHPRAPTLAELRRVFRDEDPLPPSSLPSPARRRLAGDLDAICLKALRLEPERRYASADQMLQDVQRHLAALPVEARERTLGYRSGRFVRRHAAAVAATAATSLALLGFGAFMALQSARIRAERDAARRVGELFVDLFRLPAGADPESLTIREVLDAGLTEMAGSLREQPVQRAALLDTLGSLYRNLGLYDRARPLLEQALAAREDLGQDAATLSSLENLGELLVAQGRYDEAELRLRRAAELSRERFGETHELTARATGRLGAVLFRKGANAEAETLLRASLGLARDRHGSAHPEVARAQNALGMLLNAKGEYASSERMLREAAASRRQSLGPDHPLLADTLNDLASAMGRQGKHAEAAAAQREALGIRLRTLDRDHPRVATSLNNLGVTLYQLGQNEEAESLLRESLAIRRRRLPDAHPDLAQSLSNLGLVLQATRALEEAERLYAEALAIQRRALGAKHVAVAQSLNNLSLLLRARGTPRRAEPLLREALDMLRELLGSEHPLVAINLNNLASVLADLRRDAEAERLYLEALEIRRKTLPAEHPHIAYALLGLGELLERNGRLDEAETAIREAVEIRLEAFGAEHRETAAAQGALAGVLARRGRAPETAKP